MARMDRTDRRRRTVDTLPIGHRTIHRTVRCRRSTEALRRRTDSRRARHRMTAGSHRHRTIPRVDTVERRSNLRIITAKRGRTTVSTKCPRIHSNHHRITVGISSHRPTMDRVATVQRHRQTMGTVTARRRIN